MNDHAWLPPNELEDIAYVVDEIELVSRERTKLYAAMIDELSLCDGPAVSDELVVMLEALLARRMQLAHGAAATGRVIAALQLDQNPRAPLPLGVRANIARLEREAGEADQLDNEVLLRFTAPIQRSPLERKPIQRKGCA